MKLPMKHSMKHSMKVPGKQRGIALLTVLLVFALAAFIARDMLLTGFTDTQRQIALKDSRQAFYYALGGEAFARELLWRDRDEDIEQGRNVDSKSDAWYSRELAFPLDEGQLQIRVSRSAKSIQFDQSAGCIRCRRCSGRCPVASLV